MHGVSMTTAQQPDELAGRPYGAPPAAASPRRWRALCRAAVDHGRHGRSEEGDRPARDEIGNETVQSPFGQGPDGHDRNPRRDGRGPGKNVREVLPEVGLVEDDDRAGPAGPGGRQVALDPPKVEIAVEPADEEDGVDVGDGLGLDGLRRFA
jgi:hypothetical protein